MVACAWHTCSPQAFYENGNPVHVTTGHRSARFIFLNGVYVGWIQCGVLEFLLFLKNVVLASLAEQMATQQRTRQCGPAGVLCELVLCVQLVK